MLTHLRITDFALLDDVTLDLGPGFNVLTGETGAGKSLLVDAVALLRGGRATSDVVRAGTEEARIEAVFEPEGEAEAALAKRLEAAGIATAEEGLIVRRVIGRAGGKAGRGRVYVNGALSTAAVLGELAGTLIDLAGQHEHQRLTDPAEHLGILDAFGLGLEQGLSLAILDEAARAHGNLVEAAQGLAKLSLDERARADREDFLRFQVRELDEAQLKPDEDATLKTERERLRAAEKLHAAARKSEQSLYAREGAIVDELAGLSRELDEAGKSDPELLKLSSQIGEARVSLEDAAHSLRRYADHMRADPERLLEVDERLHVVGKLLRKHGLDVAAVLEKRDEMEAELYALGSHEERRAEAERLLKEARARAEEGAARVRAARRQSAAALSKRVSAELHALGMAGAQLTVEISDRAARDSDDKAMVFDGKKLGATGWDRAEFLLAANPGEEPRPLQRVASGGELSRIMLALKRVLARTDTVATYVFDEVDSGIGGAVADVVGRQLKQVAADKQVLCVTHLPQIAAYGDAHFHVEKRSEGGRTKTVVRRLTHEERVEELARMVGGAMVTQKARDHAEDLIRNAARSAIPNAVQSAVPNATSDVAQPVAAAGKTVRKARAKARA